MKQSTKFCSALWSLGLTVIAAGCSSGGSHNATASGGTPASGGAAASGGDAAAGGTTVVDTTVPAQPWDWSGVIGSGQSLAVGQYGTPVVSTTQPYNNLKLSTGTLAWAWTDPADPTNHSVAMDPSDPQLSMVPLIEPIGRLSTNYPSSWPTNIAGETAHSSMGNQITSMVKSANGADYISVQGEFGENGQCLSYLIKNAQHVATGTNAVNGRAYAATLFETQAITNLAQKAGKTYGVGAFIMTHGECDAGNTSYESQLYQLLTDYNTDIKAITGQTQPIQMIISQQNSINDSATSTLAAWQIGVDHPTDVVCSGPKYQYAYYTDGVHLVTEGYRQLGEKYGQVYYERMVQGRNWQPLQPTSVERSGQVITVHFHVPVPPLVWDTTFPDPHTDLPAWQAGKGFEVRATSGNITINSVEISGDSVQVTCDGTLPASSLIVGYAMIQNAAAMTTPHSGTLRWGLLRDSDPFVGAMTQLPQPNWSVAFEMAVP